MKKIAYAIGSNKFQIRITERDLITNSVSKVYYLEAKSKLSAKFCVLEKFSNQDEAIKAFAQRILR